MATLYSPPAAFIAGDTVIWTQSFSEYPATAGWVVTWFFKGPSTFNIVSTASGADHLATLTAAASAALTPGDYTYTARAVLSGAKYSAASGNTRVCIDPANETASAKYTAWQLAETKYAAAVAAGMQSGGDSVKNFTRFELESLRRGVLSLKTAYERELKLDAAALGNSIGSNSVRFRFVEI